MFCSNCGEKLITPYQKFCHNCGTMILYNSVMKDYDTDPIQKITTPNTYETPTKTQKQSQMGTSGKYFKLCFWLALLSLAIGIMSYIIVYFSNFTSSYPIPIPNYEIMRRLGVMIVILLVRMGGLTLGIFSRVNASKVERLEPYPYNNIEKAGSTLVIFGIIINSLGLFLSFLSPWVSSPIPL